MHKPAHLIGDQARHNKRVVSIGLNSQDKFSIGLFSSFKVMGFVVGLLSAPAIWAGYCVNDTTTSTYTCYSNNANEVYLILSPSEYKININGFNGGYGYLTNPENSDPQDPINQLQGSGLVVISEGNNVTINNFGRIYNDNSGPVPAYVRNGGLTMMWKGDDYPNGSLSRENDQAKATGRTQKFINNTEATIEAAGTYLVYPNGYYGAGLAMFNAIGDTSIVENYGTIKAVRGSEGQESIIIYFQRGNIQFTQGSTGKIYDDIRLEAADTLNF